MPTQLEKEVLDCLDSGKTAWEVHQELDTAYRTRYSAFGYVVSTMYYMLWGPSFESVLQTVAALKKQGQIFSPGLHNKTRAPLWQIKNPE